MLKPLDRRGDHKNTEPTLTILGAPRASPVALTSSAARLTGTSLGERSQMRYPEIYAGLWKPPSCVSINVVLGSWLHRRESPC